jgi:ParB/RepB/Spo0J family partition protein
MREITMPLTIDDIVVPDGRRDVDPAVVKRLADSIENVGLRHPITIRRDRKGSDAKYILIAGRHRIEACKRLGREHVQATIVSMTNAKARMWEIAENLHRAELTVLKRKEQIAEWIELKRAQVGQVSGGRGNKGGISAAAEQLGVTRQEAQRSVRIASIKPEAKEAARDAGIDDNQSKLLEVAKEAPERQVARVHELKNSKPEPVANDDEEDEDDRDIEADIEPPNYRGAFLIRADQARRFAVYSGPFDTDVLQMAQWVATTWAQLAQNIERKLGRSA